MLTQKRLKEVLEYNQATGIFKWLKSGKGKRLDLIAGCLDKFGYICIGIDFKVYTAHRLAWLYVHGEWPNNIDHINHIGDHNMIINLREVTHQENHKNRSLSPKNKSGITGVSLHNPTGLWQANIKHDRRQRYLGRYVDKFEAICARKSAETKFGFHLNHGR